MKRSVCRFRCFGNPCSVYHFLLLLFLIVPAGCYRIDDPISTTTTPIDTTTETIFTTTATNNVVNIAFIVGGAIVGAIVGGVIASAVIGCIVAATYHNSGGGSYNPVVRTDRWVQGWTNIEHERCDLIVLNRILFYF